MASLMKEDDEQYTFPLKCSALRKGGYVLLKGKPCKIVEMSTAKPGKHGHSKVHLIGLDLFTSKKVEDVSPSTHTISVPEVTKQELVVSNISGNGYVSLLLENGEMMDGSLQITSVCDKDEEKASAMFDQAMDTDDDELVAQVLSTMGKQVIKDFKIRKAKM